MSNAQHSAAVARRPITRQCHGKSEVTEDWVAAEIPVALRYNGEPHVVMMASPTDLEDFALGFSLSEAVIASADELDILEIQTRIEGIEISLRIPEVRAEAIAQRQRNLTGRSSCGLCGTQQLEDVVRHPPAVGTGVNVRGDSLHRALNEIGSAQTLNAKTGATHAAAWVNRQGRIVRLREDVGRHNALDKLIGAIARANDQLQEGFLIITSRASYEMVQKAATVGISLVVAISAPTALAIHLADSTGVTLVGFARADGHVIYTHPQRIHDGED